MRVRPNLLITTCVALASAATLVLASSTGQVPASTPVRDLAPAVPESVGVSPERLRRLDAGMKSLVDDGRIAGLVTRLIRHGKTVSVAAHGTKDIRHGEPLKEDAIFRIYSMTKPVTGVAMMMLYEEGKWRLDDPLSRYVPELGQLKVHVGENTDGTLKLEDARRSMTMRELMTHTGGLAYGLVGTNPVDQLYREAGVLDSTLPLQRMIDGLAQLPLLAHPGVRWNYSIAVDVQGYLVEKLSGQRFDAFLRDRILEPLGMQDTAFYVPKEKLARLVTVHSEDSAGTLTLSKGNRGDPTLIPAGPSGGAGLFSTSADYARFCEMLLSGGRFGTQQLLAPRTVEMLRTNHVLSEPLKTMRQGTGWGMDVQVITDAAAAGEPYSDGAFHWYGIAGTWFWIDPVRDFAFIGMMQHDNLRTAAMVHGLSRNLVYQTLLD